MEIKLNQEEINYIKNLLISFPIRELDKVNEIIKIINQKENAEKETESLDSWSFNFSPFYSIEK